MNLKQILTLIAFLTGLQTMHAQVNSLYGRFQVQNTIGCAPFQVNVTLNAPFTCPCAVDFLGQGNTSFDPFIAIPGPVNYTQPGTYWLRVLFGGSFIDSVQITVHPNLTPQPFEMFACAGNQVNYTITDTNYPGYLVDFNDASPSSSATSGMHTYAFSGPQTVSVRGFYGVNAEDNCNVRTQPFNAVAAIPTPSIERLTVLNQSSAQLDFTTTDYVDYRIETSLFDASTFQFQQSVFNQPDAIVTGLDTENASYCFRLAAFDPCNNTTTYSNIVCSTSLDLSIQSDVNNLSWQTATSPPGYFATINQYRIERNGVSYLLVPSNLNTQNDIDVNCGTNYCYQVVTLYTNGSESYSAEKCGIAFSTTPPTPIMDISTQVNDNSVTLEWQQDPAYTPFEYSVQRSINGDIYKVIEKTTATTSVDNNYQTGNRYCYKINYRDNCFNQTTDAIEACPIPLNGVLQDDNSVTISWEPYSGWSAGVSSYELLKYNMDGVLMETIDTGTSTTYTDTNTTGDTFNQVYFYVVHALPNDPAYSNSISNTIQVVKDATPSYPKAFTPNNDGLNDEFTLFGQYVVAFDMKIFNRWGEIIYATTDMTQGWNGTFKDKLMPEGTYVFKADITDFAGRTLSVSGPFLLIRKK